MERKVGIFLKKRERDMEGEWQGERRDGEKKKGGEGEGIHGEERACLRAPFCIAPTAVYNLDMSNVSIIS